MGHEKNKLKGFNKEHYEKVKEARDEMTVLQIRCTTREKIAFELEVGNGNVSKALRIMMAKMVKGDIQ